LFQQPEIMQVNRRQVTKWAITIENNRMFSSFQTANASASSEYLHLLQFIDLSSPRVPSRTVIKAPSPS
ncbi:hypothetical protein, partial [Paenibacillus hemerocallicola]|uniref:hypothetical protein n=1 Tax=Paenibacillus hemerocallicola TaxID=1172614 RepID=UPI001C404BF5